MLALYNCKVDLKLPVTDAFKKIVEEWCLKLYTDQFKKVERWKDQFVNENLEPRNLGDKEIILTRFGNNDADGFENRSNLESSFWCITGFGLYDYMPWYKPMEQFLAKEGLNSHLPFPCIIVAHGLVRKHSDKNRKTVMNYDLFGSNNLVWGISYDETYDIDQKEIQGADLYDETYSYDSDNCVLVDVSKYHGGYLKEGVVPSIRGAINHGFWEDFRICKAKFEEMSKNGKLTKLQTLINNNS
jgi:hypothetical protein